MAVFLLLTKHTLSLTLLPLRCGGGIVQGAPLGGLQAEAAGTSPDGEADACAARTRGAGASPA